MTVSERLDCLSAYEKRIKGRLKKAKRPFERRLLREKIETLRQERFFISKGLIF